MNRHKVKTSIVVCYLMALLFAAAGCEGIDSLNESPPGQPYSWLTPKERARQNDPVASELSSIRSEMAWQRSQDELRRATEEAKRFAREQELKTHYYIQRQRLRIKQQELQRRLNEQLKGLKR
jgi:hypothetical protein